MTNRYCTNCGDGVLKEVAGDYYCPSCHCGGAACCGFFGRGLDSPRRTPEPDAAHFGYTRRPRADEEEEE